MEKRGVSTIIATIIIILILMTIVSLIVLFSNNFFGLLKRESTPVSTIYQGLKISIDSITVNSSSNPEIMTIIITRQDNEDIILRGVRFKFFDINGNSYTYDVNEPPNETGISKSYIIKNTDLNLTSFFEINNVSVIGITLDGIQISDQSDNNANIVYLTNSPISPNNGNTPLIINIQSKDDAINFAKQDTDLIGNISEPSKTFDIGYDANFDVNGQLWNVLVYEIIRNNHQHLANPIYTIVFYSNGEVLRKGSLI